MPGRHGDSDSQNAAEAGTFDTLRDEGEYFVHVKQYQKAIESFTKALEMNMEDKNCLVTRSKCWLQLGNAENALADSETALLQDKDFIRGLFQKAEALYQLGDFEMALVFFHRGHRLRPELQELRMGIQKAEEAINNSIGSPESVKLQSSGDLSYFYKHEEAVFLQTKAKQAKGTYQKPGAKKETKKERERPKSAADTKTIKQLLGELYGDKEYLEKLMKDSSLTGGRSTMERDIKDKVYDGLEYLHSRADFWRQQKPMYARKRDREKTRRSAKGESFRDPRSYILRSLDEIEEDQSEGKYEQSLKKAHKVLKQVQNMSSDELQNRAEIMATLYSSIGNAYLEMNNFNKAMDYHERDLEIAKENELEDAKSRALDNLGRVYARKGSFQKAIEVWSEKIPMSKSPLESAWLFHEIGRCHLELGQYVDAKDNGRKALEAAKEGDDKTWKLHASVLVAQSEVKNGELQAAASSFEESLEIAKALGDNVAEHAIRKALDEVNQKIVRGEDDDEEDEEQRPSTAGSAKIHESREGSAGEKARTPSPKAKGKSRTPSPRTKTKARTPSPKTKTKARTPSPKTKTEARSPSPTTKQIEIEKDKKGDQEDEGAKTKTVAE